MIYTIYRDDTDVALVRTDHTIIYTELDSYIMPDGKHSRLHDMQVPREALKEMMFDLSFLEMAGVWARNSKAERKKVGCLVTRNNNILADGYNGTPKGHPVNRCEDANGETLWYVLHAEANALMKLARSTQSSEGATVYTTLSPCKDCSKLMLQAGIARLVYERQHSDTDGIRLLIEMGVEVSQYTIRHDLDPYGTVRSIYEAK